VVKCTQVFASKLQLNAKFQYSEDLNSRTFQGFSTTFKHLICFQTLSMALIFFSKFKHLQGFFKHIMNPDKKLKWKWHLPKKATLTDAGCRGHRSVTAVTIPRVPSAPINKCLRWYPVLSLRIPLRQSTICPLAKTYNTRVAIYFTFMSTYINKRWQYWWHSHRLKNELNAKYLNQTNKTE